jgi:hypothetical protein
MNFAQIRHYLYGRLAFCKAILLVARRVVADLYPDSNRGTCPPAPMDFAAKVLILITDSKSE